MRLLNRLRPQRDAFFAGIKGQLSYLSEKLDQRCNLSGRINSANDWCKEHPRKMFAITLCSLIFCVMVSVLLPSNNGGNVALDINDIKKGTTAVQILSRNNDETHAIESEYVNMIKSVQGDINLIDSLSKKSELSHDDSMKIYVAAKRLNCFQNNKENNEN